MLAAILALGLFAEPPPEVIPPPKEIPSDGDPFPGGVVPEQISPTTRYSLSGKEVSKEQAVQALEGHDLTDDSLKPRLTVIGPADLRARVINDLKDCRVADDYAVRGYDPDHWIVRNVGFKRDGRPTIYLQRHDGKVLHRQDDYDGVDHLATAIRRADPTYDPSKDPDLRKADPSVDPAPVVVPQIPGLPAPWNYIVGLMI